MAFICTHCHYEGKRRTLTPGSTQLEWILWLVFFIPGPFYSLWRKLAQRHICPHCQMEGTMIRSWLPKGRKLRWEVEDDLLKEIEQMHKKQLERLEVRRKAREEALKDDDVPFIY